MSYYKKALSHRAISEALSLRNKYGYALDQPVCVFDIASACGLRVVFEHMKTEGFEGIYTPLLSRIALEPQRPALRQRFTCAHEIGHSVFGHGQVSCLDNGTTPAVNTPQEEFLANVFAAFLLMPKAAILSEFRRRGVSIANAEPRDFYSVACKFGVGYSTLVTHCAAYFSSHLGEVRKKELLRYQKGLSKVRAEILGDMLPSSDLKKLVIYEVDSTWSRPIDLVVGDGEIHNSDIVMFSFDVTGVDGFLEKIGDNVFRGLREGQRTLRGPDGWSGKVRCYSPVKGGWWKVRIAGEDDE